MFKSKHVTVCLGHWQTSKLFCTFASLKNPPDISLHTHRRHFEHKNGKKWEEKLVDGSHRAQSYVGGCKNRVFPKSGSCAATLHSHKHTHEECENEAALTIYWKCGTWSSKTPCEPQNAHLGFSLHSSRLFLLNLCRLFCSLWERGWSLCPARYTKNRSLGMTAAPKHTPLHIPFKKTALLFGTSLPILHWI